MNTIKLQQFSLITKFTNSYNSSNSRYIKDENKEEQLADRTIVSDWDDNGVKKQTIAKYNHLGHIISYDSHDSGIL